MHGYSLLQHDGRIHHSRGDDTGFEFSDETQPFPKKVRTYSIHGQKLYILYTFSTIDKCIGPTSFCLHSCMHIVNAKTTLGLLHD